jgi:hypothetical protein
MQPGVDHQRPLLHQDQPEVALILAAVFAEQGHSNPIIADPKM